MVESNLPEGRSQLGDLERLLDDVGDALAAAVFFRVARHHHDRNAGPDPADLLGELHTRQLGHGPVQKHDIEDAGVGLEHFERLLARGVRVDRIRPRRWTPGWAPALRATTRTRSCSPHSRPCPS